MMVLAHYNPTLAEVFMVQVKFMNNVKVVAGVDKLEINDKSVTDVRSLINYLIEHLDTKIGEYLLDDENNLRSREVVILVDGRSITNIKGLDTPITENSVVSIFNPLSGG